MPIQGQEIAAATQTTLQDSKCIFRIFDILLVTKMNSHLRAYHDAALPCSPPEIHRYRRVAVSGKINQSIDESIKINHAINRPFQAVRELEDSRREVFEVYQRADAFIR